MEGRVWTRGTARTTGGKCRCENECRKRGEREEKKKRRCLIQRKRKKRWSYESSETTWDSFFILIFHFSPSPEEQLKTDEWHQSWAVKAGGPTMSKKVFSWVLNKDDCLPFRIPTVFVWQEVHGEIPVRDEALTADRSWCKSPPETQMKDKTTIAPYLVDFWH